MKEFDIEAYLDGELSGRDLEAFENELQQNLDFEQEVRVARQLTKDLKMQGLRNEVTNILKEEDASSGRRSGFGSWISLLVSLLLLLTATYFLWPSQKTTEIEEQQEDTLVLPQEMPSSNKNESEPTLERKEETPNSASPRKEEQESKGKKEQQKSSRPIAQNLPMPPYPSPNVRGQNEENKAWKALLDQIWYTAFPPAKVSFDVPFKATAQLLTERKFSQAFVKLELQERKIPPNDTLRLLKAYCLMEMGEGADALRYFNQLEHLPADWLPTVEWYKGLSQLLSGGASGAIPSFEKMAAKPQHPFYAQSKKALQLLK